MRKAALLPAAILALAFTPGHAMEGMARYEVRVDGLSCPFCVRGLEKKLQALAGASHVQVDLETGRARLESRAPLLPEALDKAVRDAGFSPRAIHLTIQGILQISGDHWSLLIGEGRTLPLLGGRQFGRLQTLLEAGKRAVVLSGEASRVAGHWQLSVEEAGEARP